MTLNYGGDLLIIIIPILNSVSRIPVNNFVEVSGLD